MLAPLHRWIWRNPTRRVQKLLRFGETEIDGGRDLLRAAEVTSNALLRRLYLVHATDEHRHGVLFRRRAGELLRVSPTSARATFQADLLAPGGHGLDDLDVAEESDDAMLAFLHISEKSAASRFTVYRDVLQFDRRTQEVFEDILHDEMFHMNYTLTQLVRVSPKGHRSHLWRARFRRLWKGYLRLATAIAGMIGSLLLTIQYFIVLPLFAFLAKRAERREREGWSVVSPERNTKSLTNQY
jgi:rubrerythrin